MKEQYVKIYANDDRIRSAIILNNRKALTLIRKIFQQELPLSDNMNELRQILPNLSSN